MHEVRISLAIHFLRRKGFEGVETARTDSLLGCCLNINLAGKTPFFGSMKHQHYFEL